MTRKELDRLLERRVAEALGVELPKRTRRMAAAAPRKASISSRQPVAVAEMSHA